MRMLTSSARKEAEPTRHPRSIITSVCIIAILRLSHESRRKVSSTRNGSIQTRTIKVAHTTTTQQVSKQVHRISHCALIPTEHTSTEELQRISLEDAQKEGFPEQPPVEEISFQNKQAARRGSQASGIKTINPQDSGTRFSTGHPNPILSATRSLLA